MLLCPLQITLQKLFIQFGIISIFFVNLWFIVDFQQYNLKTPKNMPCNVLLIQKDPNSNATDNCFKNVITIPHVLDKSLNSIETHLATTKFTHLIIDTQDVERNLNEIEKNNNIPTLLVSEANLKTKFSIEKPPLSFEKIFAFVSNTSNFSLKTLNEYALGETDILNELKTQILEEFKLSYKQLPKLIDSENLTEIKSIVHQISSKFSLLEMEDAYKLAKDIDTNILNNKETQLNNCNKLLVDIAIVLNQLKN